MDVKLEIYETLINNKKILSSSHKKKLRESLINLWEKDNTEFIYRAIEIIPQKETKEFILPTLTKEMVEKLEPGEFDIQILESLKKIWWELAESDTKELLVTKVKDYMDRVQDNQGFTDEDEQILIALELLKLEDIPQEGREKFWDTFWRRMDNLRDQPVDLVKYILEAIWFIPEESQAENLSELIRNSIKENKQASESLIQGLSESYLIEAGTWGSVINAIKGTTNKWGEDLKRQLYMKFKPANFLKYWKEYVSETDLWDISLICGISKDLFIKKKISKVQFTKSIEKLVLNYLSDYINDENAHVILIENIEDLKEANLEKGVKTTKILFDEKVIPVLAKNMEVQNFTISILNKLSKWEEFSRQAGIISALEALSSKILDILAQDPKTGTQFIEPLENVLDKVSLEQFISKLLGLLIAKLQNREELTPYLDASEAILKHPAIINDNREKVKELCRHLLEPGQTEEEKRLGVKFLKRLNKPWGKELKEKVKPLKNYFAENE
jgi:hypothetical protein